jgi:hypothetical protein
MLMRFIPWDVWVATTLAATVVLAMIFEPARAVFITVSILLCAYIVVKTIKGDPR